MGKYYGYCRISTQKQSIKRQIEDIERIYPNAKFITEAYTGSSMDRPEWNNLMRTVRANDTIIFTEVSRMSRNAEEGFKVYKELYDRNVNLIFLKESPLNTDNFREAMNQKLQEVDTGDEDNNFLINGIQEVLYEYNMRLAQRQIKNAFAMAQHELECNHERTASGMRSKGACNIKDADGTVLEYGSIAKSKLGKKVETRKAVEVKKEIARLSMDFGGSLSDVEVMKLTGVARNTYYKYKRELKNNI